MQKTITVVLAVGLMLALAGAAQATVTNVAYWTFGDLDGKTNGESAVSGTLTSDSLDQVPLKVNANGVSYVDTGTPQGIGIHTTQGNGWPGDPNNTGYLCTTAWPGSYLSSDNWGLQGKLKFDSAASYHEFWLWGERNRNQPWPHGAWQAGKIICYIEGSATYEDTALRVYNQEEWYDVAMIQSGSASKFFVNGVLSWQGTTNSGTQHTLFFSQNLSATWAEARLFTWSGGVDDVTLADINAAGWAIPEPATMSFLVLGGLSLLLRKRSR